MVTLNFGGEFFKKEWENKFSFHLVPGGGGVPNFLTKNIHADFWNDTGQEISTMNGVGRAGCRQTNSMKLANIRNNLAARDGVK